MRHHNPFQALSKYSSAAEENYLTEALALLLRELVDHEPLPALRFVNRLCGLEAKDQIRPDEDVSIQTQVTVAQGRVDLEVRAGTRLLVYIEIKHDSTLGEQQLEYYRGLLDQSGWPQRQLVLLTRSASDCWMTKLTRDEYYHVCWYEIYNWLDDPDIKDPIVSHYASAFQGFLEEKQMSLQQVTWEYIRAPEAIMNLTAMMEAAVHATLPNVKLKRTAGWTWRGFNLNDEVFCGFRYDKPLTITFENNLGDNPTYKRQLDLQQVHFFCLGKDEQFECLVDFVRQAEEGRQ
jgi:hypothetical protein